MSLLEVSLKLVISLRHNHMLIWLLGLYGCRLHQRLVFVYLGLKLCMYLYNSLSLLSEFFIHALLLLQSLLQPRALFDHFAFPSLNVLDPIVGRLKPTLEFGLVTTQFITQIF
jgi:hypothetical protein